MIKSYLSSFGAAIVMLAFQPVKAQKYIMDKKIAIPGDGGYDYLAIDEVNRHLFVSHGTVFNVVDLATEKPVAVIEGLIKLPFADEDAIIYDPYSKKWQGVGL